jgi:NADH:ubiquinone oxidoreductase subunit F (NADH-binding)/NADH:ubiquinone oxidoreductase subunit E
MIAELPMVDPAEVDELVREIGGESHHVIRILQAIQEKYRYLPTPALERVCQITAITPSQIVGVSSFYSQFRTKPVGEHRVRVCHGTACHVKGSVHVHDAVYRHLAIPPEEDTDPALRFTVERVACLGCCTLAPVVQVDEDVHAHPPTETIPALLDGYLERKVVQETRRASQNGKGGQTAQGEIRVGWGSCCIANGSDNVQHALEEEAWRAGAQVNVNRVGCVGICHQTPTVEVLVPGNPPVLYAKVRPSEAKGIIAKHFKPTSALKRVTNRIGNFFEKALTDEAWESINRYQIDTRDPPVAAFLDRQKHIATEHAGTFDPFSLDEYIKHDGFVALKRCLQEKSPEEVIGDIQRSALRGRGGAGYLAGLKWAKVREAEGFPKYVICNGDEGDPGAFMDRMILESFPYRVIEGMAIAAYAVGASEGIFYVRAEYPLALRVLRETLEKCEAHGLLGPNILGSSFSLHLRVVEGAGAFVAGEETALLAAVEGKRSIPQLRPPYPAEKGLWEKPTLINNVETYALVPWILRNGPEAFASLGTEKSKGTKVFALAGKVARGGLIEVPMGITLREIVEDIGGGIAGGKKFKAVQVGGPSGGCVPAHLADTPVDYEALQSVGAIMGSGGLVVLDETDCMVDIARYFLQFTQNESCGKCTLCRIGSKRMLEIITRLCEGKGKPQDLPLLEHLSHEMKRASFCGLGKSAPNPVLTSLQYFREEYEAHIAGRCPAGKCRGLIKYAINAQCIGCTICYQHCPSDAIWSRPYEMHVIDTDKCTRCDMCRTVCPEFAVKVE